MTTHTIAGDTTYSQDPQSGDFLLTEMHADTKNMDTFKGLLRAAGLDYSYVGQDADTGLDLYEIKAARK